MVEKPYEETRQKVLDAKRNVTGNISSTCRFIGFGLLAIFYTIKTGDSAYAANVRDNLPWLLWAIGAFGALTILLDYLQYFFAWRSVERALSDKQYLYDKGSVPYKAWTRLFEFKQYVAAIGAVILCVAIVFSDYGVS